LICLTLLFACLLAAAPARPVDLPSPRVMVAVTAKDGGYACEAQVLLPVPQALAWEVVTDFDTMARWVSDLLSSRVLAREGAVLHVEQVGVASFGPFSFEVGMVRRIELEAPSGYLAEQVRGSFRRYNATLGLEPEAGATRLTFRVALEPGPFIGLVLSPAFVESELRQQLAAIAAIAAEAMRRLPARAGPPAGH
jgi:hypothetical protein